MTAPWLWYLNRGTGVVLLVLFTLTTVLGVLATGRRFTPWWPRFVTQGLHRSLAALSLAVLVGHVVTAVVDEYVDIRWWESFVPFAGTYQPVPLGLGTLALDLLVVVTVTSLLRHRLPQRLWFVVHLTTYLVWLLGVLHGIGIGTDAERSWMAVTNEVCIVLVAGAVLLRLFGGLRRWTRNEPGVPAR